jgi:hypothetical protein
MAVDQIIDGVIYLGHEAEAGLSQRGRNSSGGSLTIGSVVTLSHGQTEDPFDFAFTTTTTLGDEGVIGVLTSAVSDNRVGSAQVRGHIGMVKVNGTTNIAVGDWLESYSSAGIAAKSASAQGVFARALEAYTTDDSAGEIKAIIMQPPGMRRLDDNVKLHFGTGRDAYIEYDGTNMNVNPRLVGTGGVSLQGALTIGVNDTGYDVKFFGASSGAFFLYEGDQDRLEIRGPAADATTSTGKLLLSTALTDINANDVLGRIDFKAPLEAGSSDAILTAVSIQAVAQATFSSTVNETDLIFLTGKSEAATEKFRITADGELGVGGANYGSSGQVLTSGGAGSAPSWAAAASGDITAVSLTGDSGGALSVASGAAGFTLTGGTGVDTSGSGTTVTFALDLSELTDTAIAHGDYIVFTDTTDSNASVKGDLADVATLFAGTNLTASSSVISVDDSFVTNSGNDTMTGALTVSNTTDTTSGASGAIHTTGGLGVTKKVFIGGTTFIGGGSATARLTLDSNGAAGTLIILDSDKDNSSGGDDTTGADAVIRFREHNAAAFEVGHDASSNVFTIGANDDAGGNDALRITDATPPVVSFNTSLGSDFDYVCDGCGRHEAAIFTCCSKVEWHDDVMDFRAMSLRKNSAMDYMERVGVIERTTNNAGDPEVFTSFDMVYFVGSMAWQNRQRMDRLFNKFEQRLQKLEAV